MVDNAPEAKVAFVRGSDEQTVTVRLENLTNASHVRVHAAESERRGDGTLPATLSEPGEDIEVADLGDDEIIVVTAVGEGIERVVARYQE